MNDLAYCFWLDENFIFRLSSLNHFFVKKYYMVLGNIVFGPFIPEQVTNQLVLPYEIWIILSTQIFDHIAAIFLAPVSVEI